MNGKRFPFMLHNMTVEQDSQRGARLHSQNTIFFFLNIHLNTNQAKIIKHLIKLKYLALN